MGGERCGVVVTRPVAQAAGLVEALRTAGLEPIPFPAMEILPPRDWEAADRALHRLAHFDRVLFISANAVAGAFGRLAHLQIPFPAGLPTAAIGRATARALARHGLTGVLTPEGGHDSEALLRHPLFEPPLEGQEILIIRGEGGKELLARTLTGRGARITYAEVYRRERPTTDPTPLLERWERGEVQVVTATSGEILRNLATLLGERGRPLLRRTPLVVISPSMVQLARRMGVTAPVVQAAGPDDGSVVEATLHLCRKSPPTPPVP